MELSGSLGRSGSQQLRPEWRSPKLSVGGEQLEASVAFTSRLGFTSVNPVVDSSKSRWMKSTQGSLLYSFGLRLSGLLRMDVSSGSFPFWRQRSNKALRTTQSSPSTTWWHLFGSLTFGGKPTFSSSESIPLILGPGTGGNRRTINLRDDHKAEVFNSSDPSGLRIRITSSPTASVC